MWIPYLFINLFLPLSPLPSPLLSSPVHKRLHQGVKLIESEEEWAAAKDESQRSRLPLIVQFTGSFCKPCKKIAPTFDALAATHTGIFARVDVGVLGDVAVEEGVGSIPAFHWYRDGKLVDSMVGANDEKLTAMVRRYC